MRPALGLSGQAPSKDGVLRSMPWAALARPVSIEDVDFVSLHEDALTKYFLDVPTPLSDHADDHRD